MSGFCGVLALPGLRKPDARTWAAAIVLAAVLDTLATSLPFIDQQLQFPGVHFNWAGKLLSLGAMLLMSAWLIATQRVTALDIGLTIRQAPGTGRALLTVLLPYLVLLALLTALLFGNSSPPTRETLAYEATMPGLAEELAYRGVLLALFNRMSGWRFRLLGAQMGYGALALSTFFGLLHGVGFDQDLHFQFSPLAAAWTCLIGFVLAWLRERTQSLVVPVLAHNATNLIFESVLRLF